VLILSLRISVLGFSEGEDGNNPQGRGQNPSHAVRTEIAQEFSSDKALYEKKVKELVTKYAK
jgi:hypothetical protein